MRGWLVYPLSFLLFLAGALAYSLVMRAFSRKVHVDSREIELREALPGHDCGMCGLSGCRAFAASLIRGETEIGRCAPGGREVERQLRSILGDAGEGPNIAILRCGASKTDSPDLFSYSGIGDCAVAQSIYGGPRACRDACLGYGSCLPYCPVGAIGAVSGQLSIDPDLCTGCGACVAACPTGVIALVPADAGLYVACNSKLDIARRMEICNSACKACHICEQPDGAPSFIVKEGLASRSQWKIADLGSFMRSCPTGVIRDPRHSLKSGSPF